MLVLLDNSFFAFINIYTLLRGLAVELAAVKVEPALGAVAVDGVDHGSNARSDAVVVTPGAMALLRRSSR